MPEEVTAAVQELREATRPTPFPAFPPAPAFVPLGDDGEPEARELRDAWRRAAGAVLSAVAVVENPEEVQASPAHAASCVRALWGAYAAAALAAGGRVRGKRRAGAAAEAESALGWRGEAGRGLRVVDTFAGVGAALAALLKAGFHVAHYVYADTCAKAKKAARWHLKRLSRKYPEQLPLSAWEGAFPCLVVVWESGVLVVVFINNLPTPVVGENLFLPGLQD